MMRAFLTLCLACQFAWAGGPSVSGGGFPLTGIVLFNGACPPGWSEDTTAQGRYIVGLAASGSPGDTLGSAIATTTTDTTITATSDTPTITCTNPNNLSAIGGSGYCDNRPAPTMTTPVITMGTGADQRAELAPSVSLRLCKKS